MSSKRTQVDRAADVAWARAAFEAALEDSSTPAAPIHPEARFDDYELLATLGHGATAIVYRAHQRSLNRIVALKMMVDADLANEAEVRRFRFGAEAAAKLDHPNIAPIYEVGEQDGMPYFTMRLFQGGTLARSLARLRQSRVGAVALLAKVARAVHYAHQRGVLHRDLKPANIVIDEHDEPFVVDFGFAKHLDERALTSKHSVAGTICYMAPEQATADARSLTFASDIYGLGTILYELLTGTVPYEGLPLSELLRRLTSSERVRSPRAIDPSLDRELEYVCLKSLEKDPARRYGTALELAQDLERWLRDEPISIASERSAARFFRWCRAHPALFTLLAGAACVLAATASVAVSVAREQERALLSEVLQANSYAAQAKAGQVLFQLRELSDPVARCASDPRIEELLARNAAPTHPARADRLLIECGATSLFDSVALVDRAGSERARLPRRARPLAARELVQRDAFVGAERLARAGYRSVYVGRVLHSAELGERHVSLSAPVFDADNQWLGVVNVTIALSAFLDSLQLSDSERQMAVLAGVREAEPGDPPGTSEQGVMVLLHGPRADAQELAQSPWTKELARLKQTAIGRDPFRFSEPSHSLEDNSQAYALSAFGNRWLAGFAPVGHTGYAVIVQTRYDAALEVPQRALVRLLGWSGAIFVLGGSVVLLLAWLLGRRAPRRRA